MQEIKLGSASKIKKTDVLLDSPACDSAESLILEPIEPTLRLLPYLRLFWETRSFLSRAGLSAAVISAIFAFLVPVRYQSVTRLMPPDDQSSGLGMLAAMASSPGGSALTGLAGNLLGIKSSGDLFVGILGSDTIQDHLIGQFGLSKVYGDSKIEDARADLAEHSSISADRKSGIVSISVTDHDPSRAAAIAQAYVSELNVLVSQLSTSAARRERIFLEERLQEVKTDLDSAEQKFSVFASKNTAIDIPEQGKAMVDAAATLQGQLIAAQAELSGLQQIYTDKNVRVRAAQAHVEELQKKLNELGGVGTQSDLQSETSLYPSIRRLPLLGVTYADLYRQTKIQETVYEVLTQQYELAKVQEAKEIPTVRVLDPAMVPTKKSFPPRILITILGTMLGVVLAMTWIVGKAYWEAVDASDPRKALAIEVFTAANSKLPHLARNGNGTSAESNGRQRHTLTDSDVDRVGFGGEVRKRG